MKLRILHINSYYSRRSFYKHFFESQLLMNNEIDVYVPTSVNAMDGKSFGEYTKIVNTHNKFDRLLFFVKHDKIWYDFFDRYKNQNFDIVHAHSLFSNGYIAYRYKKRTKVPYVVTIRNTDLNLFFCYMIHLRKLGLEILKEAAKIIFLSPAYRDKLLNDYCPKNIRSVLQNKSVIIPNGIDEFWLNTSLPKRPVISGNCLKIVYVGVINKNKNVVATLKAIDYLIKNGYEIEFTVVGEILDKRVFSEIKKREYTRYLTQRTKEELLKVYQQNHIFVMPSRTETFGLVYVEAMSQGLPIIYSKNQGFDGQYEDGQVGYCVDSKQPFDIASAIKKIIDNYSFLSATAYINSRKFSWSKITKAYLELYRECT